MGVEPTTRTIIIHVYRLSAQYVHMYIYNYYTCIFMYCTLHVHFVRTFSYRHAYHYVHVYVGLLFVFSQ